MHIYEYADAFLGQVQERWYGFLISPDESVRIIGVDLTRVRFLNLLGADGWLVWNWTDMAGSPNVALMLRQASNLTEYHLPKTFTSPVLSGRFSLRRER